MYQNSYNSFWKNIFYSKIIFGIFLILIIFIGWYIFKEKNNQQKAADSISLLRAEINKLENKNLELAKMIQYLRTNDFVENEAREKLGMQKRGEKVVIVPKIEQKIIEGDFIQKNFLPNYLKWWKYFFK